MTTELSDFIAFSDKLKFTFTGKKKINQDCLKDGILEKGSFFIVCDGVGGEISGEIAGRLACESYASFFTNLSTSIDEKYLIEATTSVENAFDDYLDQHPQNKGMATTVALLYIYEKQIWSLYAGDSRIYHIRGNQILFMSRDHSVVNELLDNNLITTEEAEESNQKHILTRVIQGRKLRATRPTIKLLEDVEKNDYFFICTDGVTESITDEQLVKILSGTETSNNKVEIIKELCAQKSFDNYSGYLLRVK